VADAAVLDRVAVGREVGAVQADDAVGRVRVVKVVDRAVVGPGGV
jgi:hypothetical protein